MTGAPTASIPAKRDVTRYRRPSVIAVVFLRADRRDAVQTTRQSEVVCMLGVVGAAMGLAGDGTDAGSGGVLVGVEDAAEQRGIRRPPLLVVHGAVQLQSVGIGRGDGGGLDEGQQVGEGVVGGDVLEV